MFEEILDWLEATVTGNRLFAAIVICALAVLPLVFITLACTLARKVRKLKKTLVAARRETDGNGVQKDEARKDAAKSGAWKQEEMSEHGAQESGDVEDDGTEKISAEGGAYKYCAKEEAVTQEEEWAEGGGRQQYEFEITEDDYAEEGSRDLYVGEDYDEIQTPDGKAGNSFGAGSLRSRLSMTARNAHG